MVFVTILWEEDLGSKFIFSFLDHHFPANIPGYVKPSHRRCSEIPF
jgi:hypothetical protein